MLMPWLDEMVALSVDGLCCVRFHRMQALWHAVIDQVAPFIRISPHRTSPHQRARARPTLPRDRRFMPLREEARQVRDALRGDIARAWVLPELAGRVHLSTKQLSRVFVDAYGKTPLTYLTMLRVEEMADCCGRPICRSPRPGAGSGSALAIVRRRVPRVCRDHPEPVPDHAVHEWTCAHEMRLRCPSERHHPVGCLNAMFEPVLARTSTMHRPVDPRIDD